MAVVAMPATNVGAILITPLDERSGVHRNTTSELMRGEYYRRVRSFGLTRKRAWSDRPVKAEIRKVAVIGNRDINVLLSREYNGSHRVKQVGASIVAQEMGVNRIPWNAMKSSNLSALSSFLSPSDRNFSSRHPGASCHAVNHAPSLCRVQDALP
jgi:hypothetical protein